MTEEPFEELLEKAVDRYRRNLRRRRGRGPSDVTIRNKFRSLRVLNRKAQRFFPGNPCALVEVLGNRQLFLDLKASLEEEVSPGTLRHYVMDMRDLEEYMVEAGMKSHTDIVTDDIPSAGAPPPIVIYTEQEVERLKGGSWMGGFRWAGFIHFLAATGRRVGEAMSLQFDTLRHDREGYYFELDRTKNGDQCYVPVPDDYAELFLTGDGWQELLHEYDGRTNLSRNPDVYLFPWAYSSVHSRFKRLCKRTKVPNRGFHNFRHTVITNRIASGMPLQAVASLAGHRNPTLTATRYNHATALNYRGFLNGAAEPAPTQEPSRPR